MLKIKDDKWEEFKEIAHKFGFVYISGMLLRRYIKGNVVIFENDLNNREDAVKLKKQPLVAKIIYVRTCYREETEIAPIDDVLVDLIQAGLVEEV